MRPIVDGLGEEYRQQVDFVYLNAADRAQGQAAYEAYGLRGHPAFVWVEPSGAVGWKRIGEMSADTLEQAIREGLAP